MSGLEHRFDFFADRERSIGAAEVEPGQPSPCHTDGSADVVAPVPNATHEEAERQPAIGPDSFSIRLDTGEVRPLGIGLVFGRAPGGAGTGDAEPVVLEDDEGLISRNHVVIVPQEAGPVALDLGSTNGTTLLRDGQTAALPPRQPVNLRSGDHLIVGGRTLSLIAD